MKPIIHQHHMGAYTVIVKGRKYGVNIVRSGDAWAGFINGDFVPQTKAPRTEHEALKGVVAHLGKSKQPKVSIRCNQWGNWYGYIGGRKVTEFYRTSQQSQQEAAKAWLAEQRKILSRI